MRHIQLPDSHYAINRVRRFRNGVYISTALAIAVMLMILLSHPSSTLSTWHNADGNHNAVTAGDSQFALNSSEPKISAHWPGWNSIKHMVVFGDSLTATDFNHFKEQPSESNPLGNPAFPGNTSAIGTNWIGYLTGTYNATFVKTVNLAQGGATVDGEKIEPIMELVKTFKRQVAELWLRFYTGSEARVDWKADDTLFLTFFGSNDVIRAYFNSWQSALKADVDEYAAGLEELYQSGARNFLLVNVPPLERSPSPEAEGDEGHKELGSLVNEFNDHLARITMEFRSTHEDATIFLFDNYALFNQILDDPCSYEETCPLKVTTTYCEAYEHEQTEELKYDPECQYSVDKYFWLNTLHPSGKVHQAMAKAIVTQLDNAT